MVPVLIETVDKLDLSTEPENEDEEDKVDEETNMDTLSESQVTALAIFCPEYSITF